MKIRVNGVDTALATDGSMRFTDLIELIKASIDPDHILTGIFIDEGEVSDTQWAMTLEQLGNVVFDVTSGPASAYVAERLRDAPLVIRSCYLEFRDARKGFQEIPLLAISA
jgi:hypothetical protein